MKSNCIILSANPYKVEDEKTARVNEGISIQYIMGDSLLPSVDGTSKLMGYRVLKGSVSKYENEAQLKAVPAIMEVEFDIKADSSGKPSLKPVTLKFLAELQKLEK